LGNCAQEMSTFNWKDYFPLISPIVVIILFGLERWLSYNIRKREIERTWYYKVLIEPSLTKIGDFFKDTQDLYKASCEKLALSNNMPHNEYNSLKSSEIGKFQQVKRAFEIDFVTPINHRYPNVGLSLQNILMDLEDKFSNGLDSEFLTQTNIETFVDSVSNSKVAWLNTLYEPINN